MYPRPTNLIPKVLPDGCQEGDAMRHSPRLLRNIHSLIRRWFGFYFDLTGLTIDDGDIMLDLASGRD